MRVVSIYIEPAVATRMAIFAADGKVMRLSIAVTFSPDTHNLPLYAARMYLAQSRIEQFVDSDAVSVLLGSVLTDLAKEGAGYCEECAEDRLRDGLRSLGLVLHDMARTLKSNDLLLD